MSLRVCPNRHWCTPPDNGTEEDDILTASEIAQLKLDADWVPVCVIRRREINREQRVSLVSKLFLCRCPGTLVSHWPVESTAATQLTTTMFDELKASPKIGRSEALRRSMMKLASKEDRPDYAHPVFWAPFVVVGEGAN